MGVGGCRIVRAAVSRGAFISYSRRRPFCQYNGVEGGGGSGSFNFLTNQALPGSLLLHVTSSSARSAQSQHWLHSLCALRATDRGEQSGLKARKVVVVVV